MSGHIQNICKAEHNFINYLFILRKLSRQVPTLSEKKNYTIPNKNKQKTVIGIEKNYVSLHLIMVYKIFYELFNFLEISYL